MKILRQYQGLRRENYVLFLGRIVTNLGSMVWPVLTLILTRKMGMTATEAAVVMIISGIVLVPVGLLGGKLADKYNKKFCIIYCDIVSIAMYLISAFIPLGYGTIALIVVAAACQSMEHPAYNALIADITYTRDRERAYSLQYLGSNIGLVASPVIAGFLFEKYLWLAFLISGIAIAISTVLIYLLVQNIEPVREEGAGQQYQYQKNCEHEKLSQILKKNKIVLLYLFVISFYYGAYLQYSYLLPLDMVRCHGDKGAVIYGSVSSLNCVVVVLFTPIFTRIFRKKTLTGKTFAGNLLVLAGYLSFLLFLGKIPVYYAAIVLFTFGEILTTIANGPYLAERVPASHRGRINGLMALIQSLMQGICLITVGPLYDRLSPTAAWIFVLAILSISTIGSAAIIVWDRRAYEHMYQKSEKHN